MLLNRISRPLLVGLLTLGLLMSWSGETAAQTLPQPTPSASPSPSSDTRASDEALRRACADAVAELRAARKLIDAQQVELGRYAEILKLETEIRSQMKRIGELGDQEKTELRSALDAKDRQVAALEAAIAALKRDRPSFWKKLGWVVVGAGAGVVIGGVLNR